MSINMSEEDYAQLEAYAKEQGKSLDEFLRDAILLERYAGEVRKSGGKLLIEKDGQVNVLQYA